MLRPDLELSKHSIKVKYYYRSGMIPVNLELEYGRYTLDKYIKLYTIFNVRNHVGL